jgi:hypothetical protein
VKGRLDLIDHLAGLVAEANNPRRLAERTLAIVITLVNARSAALFRCLADDLALFTSASVDQHSLDAAARLWEENRASLQRGEVLYRAEWSPRTKGGAPASLALIPLIDDSNNLFAILYVDGSETHFCSAGDLDRLSKFAPVALRALRGETAEAKPPTAPGAWEEYLAKTPVADMEREKLLLLLSRNEWNIARVARLMGVTRRTIYLRLQRHHIPRERVPKSRRRGAKAPRS